ncbi:MAG: type II secretion system F family protein [Candidatus Omnitrophica bacterium]|nr:type II secretion system F family protein [Candidatus Omnitrophota bacterium]
MLSFAYKARDPNGKLVNGIINAEGEINAASAIEKLGLSPVSISLQAVQSNVNSVFGFYKKKISHQDILSFTRQLATLISTGEPLIQSLNSIAGETGNARFKQIIKNLVFQLESGSSFSAALSKYPEVFPRLYVNLVNVGETGGLLDKILNRLAKLSTQELALRSRLQAALVYPAVLAGVAFLIVNFVLVGVLPRFVTIFEASSVKPPIPTRIILFMSGMLRNFWWAFLLAGLIGLNRFRAYYRSEQGRFAVDSFILRLPLFGPLILKIIVSRFSRSLASLIQSGIPVYEALSVVEATVSNSALRKVIKDTRIAIAHGQSVSEPFKASGLFPSLVIQLINTGEHSGRLDKMFDEIADFYEPEIEYTVRNLTSLLEPAMLLGMGLVVAFIALAVLMPIFNLINVVRR